MKGAILLFSLISFLPICGAADLWVSTKGNDGNPGTQALAMATIEAAIARDPLAHLHVEPGNYRLANPLILSKINSGLIIEGSVPASPPVISGGRTVSGFKPYRGGIWRARVDFRFEQLWVNGARAVRARTPNSGWLFMQAPVGYALNPATGKAQDYTRQAFRLKSADFPVLGKLSAGELRDVQVNVWHSWSVSQHGIAQLDREKEIALLKGPSQIPFFNLGRNQRYQLENYLAALDQPGEWFLDREGWLYYKPLPHEDMRKAEVVAPVVSRFLTINGADRVVIRNVRFEYSGYQRSETDVPGMQGAAEAGAAVVVENAGGVELNNVAIAHTGEYAVWFAKGSHDSVLRSSVMRDLGAGGVRIGLTNVVPDQQASMARITVEKNTIEDGGEVFPGAVGILIGHSGGNRIAGNTISRFYYSGISAGWVWGYAKSLATNNVIEGNYIHHLGEGVLSDMAGIYTLGVSPGTVIRGNVIHDVLSYDRYGRGAWGIYADEGTSDIVVENNLVYRTSSGGFHQHYGRNNLVKDNIFAFGRDAQLQRTKAENELAFTFVHNIVLSHGAPMLNGVWRDGKVVMEDNLYFDFAGEPRWLGATFKDWQAGGMDARSQVANPGFADAPHDNFDFAAGSVAAQRRAGIAMPLALATASTSGRKSAAVRNATKMPQGEPPAPVFSLSEDFETQDPGTPPAFATLSVENRGDSVVASTEQAHSGRQSIKMTDVPGLQHDFDPHFYYRPNHSTGETTVRFAIWMGEGARFYHEWRDDSRPYHAGPSISIQDNRLFADGNVLGTIVSKKWITVEISASLGADPGRKWTLQVMDGDSRPLNVRLPLKDQKWSALNWLGFVSNDTKASVIYLDDLSVSNKARTDKS